MRNIHIRNFKKINANIFYKFFISPTLVRDLIARKVAKLCRERGSSLTCSKGYYPCLKRTANLENLALITLGRYSDADYHSVLSFN